MTGLYLFCAAVGLPLLAWFIFAGDADGGDGFGDAEGPLAWFSAATIAFAMAFFGMTGLALENIGTASALTLVLAVVIGVAAGFTNSAVFRWLKRNSTTSTVADHELEGAIAQVALPVSSDHRGKIILNKAGAREQMTASPVDGSSIGRGDRVVIVRVERGVALVAPLGPDLELDGL